MSFGHCEYAECLICYCVRLNVLLTIANLETIVEGAFRQALKRVGWVRKDQKQQISWFLLAVPEGKENNLSEIRLEPVLTKKFKCSIIKASIIPERKMKTRRDSKFL